MLASYSFVLEAPASASIPGEDRPDPAPQPSPRSLSMELLPQVQGALRAAASALGLTGESVSKSVHVCAPQKEVLGLQQPLISLRYNLPWLSQPDVVGTPVPVTGVSGCGAVWGWDSLLLRRDPRAGISLLSLNHYTVGAGPARPPSSPSCQSPHDFYNPWSQDFSSAGLQVVLNNEYSVI